MKFPRNARIFRGQLDATPFVSVFFLLVIFVMLRSRHYIPGVRVELPSSGNLLVPSTDRPTVSVAVLANKIYFRNQAVSEADLVKGLHEEAQKSSQPLILVLEADKNVPEEEVVHLAVIARQAGIPDLLLATRPNALETPNTTSPRP